MVLTLKKIIAIPIVLLVIVVGAYYLLQSLLPRKTNSIEIIISAPSTPWSGRYIIEGDGRVIEEEVVEGTGNRIYLFERPQGVENWRVFISLKKKTELTYELKVLIYDSMSGKLLAEDVTKEPFGTVEAEWSG